MRHLKHLSPKARESFAAEIRKTSWLLSGVLVYSGYSEIETGIGLDRTAMACLKIALGACIWIAVQSVANLIESSQPSRGSHL
jgi:hypothetical protein